MAAPEQPHPEHAKGTNVTAPDHQFRGVVVDHNVSYRVDRLAYGAYEPDGSAARTPVVVSDAELRDTDVIVETYLSYLVHRDWDGMDVWMEPASLVSGHVDALAPSTQPGAQPAGGRPDGDA